MPQGHTLYKTEEFTFTREELKELAEDMQVREEITQDIMNFTGGAVLGLFAGWVFAKNEILAALAGSGACGIAGRFFDYFDGQDEVLAVIKNTDYTHYKIEFSWIEEVEYTGHVINTIPKKLKIIDKWVEEE